MKIGVINFKGGQGKSLIAHQLITGFHYKGVEVDPYGSLSRRLPEGSVIYVDIRDKKLPEPAGDVVYDFGGFDDKKIQQAAKICDVILVPFMPGDESAMPTLNTLKKMKEYNAPTLLIANCADKQAELDEFLEGIFTALNVKLDVFKLPRSRSFNTAVNAGVSVLKLAEQKGIRGIVYKKAAKVITELHDMILKFA